MHQVLRKPRLCALPSRIPRWRRCASSGTSAIESIEPTKSEIHAARLYCAQLLQKYDAPSYTLQAFIPSAARDAYLAIRAFNLDTAHIADSVSSAAAGRLRMQFWRDALAHTFAGRPPRKPVALLLYKALSDMHVRGAGGGGRNLSRHWFLRVVDAREQYLGNAPYASVAALEAYAEATYSALLYLTLAALPVTSVAADHIASHIGKAAGITAVLRGLPLLAFPQPPKHHSRDAGCGSGGGERQQRQGAVLLPLDVMAEAGVKEEDVLRHGSSAAGLRDAVFAVATRANDHLITAREMLKSIKAGGEAGHEFEHVGEEGHEYPAPGDGRAETPRQEVERAFGVFMPAVADRLWLEKLEALDFDIFRPELRKSDWKLAWKAYLAYSQRSLD
ncbi:MAG: hypothetical protein M1829_002956 [Trizodia sp. TS-e1964]|nr:MAG: hypothetical protein M1829_002956 [Trizodia sp. TS-e1964]